MKDWKLRLAQNQGLLVAIGLFILSYGLYSFCTHAGSALRCSARTPTNHSSW